MFSILRKKNVKQIKQSYQVTGHLENEGIIWNEKGESFSTEFDLREKDGELVGVFGSSLERNKMYDLKFE